MESTSEINAFDRFGAITLRPMSRSIDRNKCHGDLCRIEGDNIFLARAILLRVPGATRRQRGYTRWWHGTLKAQAPSL